jgi:hypothetical protein
VSVKPVPETYNRQDWPRLVANLTKDHEARLAAVEAGGGTSLSGGFALDDGTASASGVFAFDDGGA